jgi:hypothetical protein
MLLPLRHPSHSLNPLGHGSTHLPTERRTTTQRITLQRRILHTWNSVIHSPETGCYRFVDSNIESDSTVYDLSLGASRIDRFDYFRLCDYTLCAVFADESGLDADDTWFAGGDVLESGCVGLLFYWGWRYLPIPLLTDDKKVTNTN